MKISGSFGFSPSKPQCNWMTCCRSVAQSCLTRCNPMDCSTPGFLFFHYFLAFGQIHVHWVGGAIQLSHSLSPPSPPALNLSHAGLFQWVGSSHLVAKVLELQLCISPSNEYSQGWFPLGLTDLFSLLFRGLSRVFSNTTVWKHQFFRAQPSLWSNSHISNMTTGKNISLTDYTDLCWQSDVFAF